MKQAVCCQCAIDLLKKPNAERINHWLSRFVVEARRSDGKQHLHTTLANLLAGLYRYSKKFDPSVPNFMNKKDGTFKDLYGALEIKYYELRVAGVGADVKHSPIVTKEEEDTLWKSSVLGDQDPVALQRAVFFMSGRCFASEVAKNSALSKSGSSGSNTIQTVILMSRMALRISLVCV